MSSWVTSRLYYLVFFWLSGLSFGLLMIIDWIWLEEEEGGHVTGSWSNRPAQSVLRNGYLFNKAWGSPTQKVLKEHLLAGCPSGPSVNESGRWHELGKNLNFLGRRLEEMVSWMTLCKCNRGGIEKGVEKGTGFEEKERLAIKLFGGPSWIQLYMSV